MTTSLQQKNKDHNQTNTKTLNNSYNIGQNFGT